MKPLEGKTALVTGSDSGIGRAIAIEFARQGASVIITYHSDEKGAFSVIFKEFEQLDILVNNAGVNGSGIPLAEMPTEVFDKTIKTNLYGTFFCCRAFVQYLKKENRKGKIINVSSVHEEIAAPGNADYNASKGGIRNLTRTLALELAADDIPVNNIAPGMILTHMNQAAMDDPKVRKEKEQHIPMKRAGKPEEIAKLALYLAGPDSSYITGATFVMDGGLSQYMGQGA